MALVGDLWDEIGDAEFWRDLSELPEIQAKTRSKITDLCKNSLIIPGHGEPFLASELES